MLHAAQARGGGGVAARAAHLRDVLRVAVQGRTPLPAHLLFSDRDFTVSPRGGAAGTPRGRVPHALRHTRKQPFGSLAAAPPWVSGLAGGGRWPSGLMPI